MPRLKFRVLICAKISQPFIHIDLAAFSSILERILWPFLHQDDNFPYLLEYSELKKSTKHIRNDWSLRQLKKDAEDEIHEVKNVCSKKLPDILVCKTNLLQGLQE